MIEYYLEMQSMQTKEEREVQTRHWTALVRMGKQLSGEIPMDEVADVAPHLVGRRQ